MTEIVRKFFELKEEHLKLLRNMIVSWDDCEFGAPTVNCKKPYGNSHVYGDMSKILDIEGVEDSKKKIHFSKEQVDLMDKLHKETKVALQIVLKTGKFEPGIYVTDEYRDNWTKVHIL
jgi:hypothetical protein